MSILDFVYGSRDYCRKGMMGLRMKVEAGGGAGGLGAWIGF